MNLILTHPLFLFLVLLSGQAAVAQDTLDLYPDQKKALVCWSETRSVPRALRIYYLKVNLSCPDLEVITITGDDPDGEGPAESTLTLPGELFSTHHALAAINANAFAGLPGTENDARGWYEKRPVDIQGMAVSDTKVISPVQRGRTAFWIDTHYWPHVGNPVTGDSVSQAVSDWSSPLLINNSITPDSTITILHPRSALGFDDSGKWLLMIVVDGRQPGFSEGVSLYELARLFRSKGCTQAINLDGGGSSIMLIRDQQGKTQTFNRPSGILSRPIPVMLGVRKRL